MGWMREGLLSFTARRARTARECSAHSSRAPWATQRKISCAPTPFQRSSWTVRRRLLSPRAMGATAWTGQTSTARHRVQWSRHCGGSSRRTGEPTVSSQPLGATTAGAHASWMHPCAWTLQWRESAMMTRFWHYDRQQQPLRCPPAPPHAWTRRRCKHNLAEKPLARTRPPSLRPPPVGLPCQAPMRASGRHSVPHPRPKPEAGAKGGQASRRLGKRRPWGPTEAPRTQATGRGERVGSRQAWARQAQEAGRDGRRHCPRPPRPPEQGRQGGPGPHPPTSGDGEPPGG
mmetsp:Transcript_784/g.2361  ORF Transcript_784/g.2361 Transcript_784/m.2361 type:complete len:288 (+) Transcript_784:534-1397(+)